MRILLASSLLLVAACGSSGHSRDGGVNADGATPQTDGDSANDGSTSAPGDAATGTGVGPTAPTAFTLVHQGDNSFQMTWTAATPGMSPIDHYEIYRNGKMYATSTTTSYTDNKATFASAPSSDQYNPSGPATTYAYDVSAVDKAGNEGPKAAQMTAWVYHAGMFDWSGEYNFGTLTSTYDDTSGMPTDGTKDIEISCNGGGWQPYSGAPFLDNTIEQPGWWMEIGGFNFMTIDLKPTKANQTWALNVISRAPPGDVFNSGAVTLPGNFGPAPEVGKWATYKVPFLPASGSADGTSLEVGYGTFVGSISGTTLTVTKMGSGLNVQGGSWLTGTGIAPNTYISTQSNNAGPGTYTISPSQMVASTTITAQRTNMYKFSLIDELNQGANVYYVDNIAFTTK